MTKTKSTALTTTTTDPRLRMKEIRRLVAETVKSGGRVDLLDLKADDKNRALIALQDLLDTEKTKHSKAREHIVSLKSGNDFAAFIINETTMSKLEDLERIGQLSAALKREQEISRETHLQLISAHDQIAQLTTEVEDTMNTLRIALNGSNNG